MLNKMKKFKDQDITNGYIFMKVIEDEVLYKKIIKVLFDIDRRNKRKTGRKVSKAF